MGRRAMPRSWDFFDTLSARVGGHPQSAWWLMGERLKSPAFIHNRVLADRRTKTIDAAYDYLAVVMNWDEKTRNRMLELELKTEVEASVPIWENLNQVEDGDIILSDFYGNKRWIEAILDDFGFDKKVEIIVTPSGKRNGWVWDELPFKPSLHTGDSIESDIESAQAHGIQTRYYDKAKQFDYGDQIGLLTRALRLASFYDLDSKEGTIWDDQAALNVPALTLIALELPNEPILFTLRDCWFLKDYAKTLRPELPTESIQLSRALYKENHPSLLKLLTPFRNHRIVDLQGTGRSVTEFWLQHFRHKPKLLYVCSPEAESLVPHGWDGIEYLNPCPVGTYSAWGVIEECEYPSWVLEVTEEVNRLAIEYLPCLTLKPDRARLTALCQAMENCKSKHLIPHLDPFA